MHRIILSILSNFEGQWFYITIFNVNNLAVFTDDFLYYSSETWSSMNEATLNYIASLIDSNFICEISFEDIKEFAAQNSRRVKV